jgi:VIT1/CCC1 family predicted Fe2+/Mn2+ transporter
MSREDEVERLRKLRDRQISLRDPQVQQKKVQQHAARRQRRSRQPFVLSNIFTQIPKVITFTLVGMLLGLLVLIVLPYFVQQAWTDTAGIVATIILAIFGAAFGQAVDVRDRLRDI